MHLSGQNRGRGVSEPQKFLDFFLNWWHFSKVAQHQIALTFDVWTIFGGQDDGEKIMFNLVAALLVLPVLGLGGLQGDGLAAARSVRVPRVRDLLLRHYPVDF